MSYKIAIRCFHFYMVCHNPVVRSCIGAERLRFGVARLDTQVLAYEILLETADHSTGEITRSVALRHNGVAERTRPTPRSHSANTRQPGNVRPDKHSSLNLVGTAGTTAISRTLSTPGTNALANSHHTAGRKNTRPRGPKETSRRSVKRGRKPSRANTQSVEEKKIWAQISDELAEQRRVNRLEQNLSYRREQLGYTWLRSKTPPVPTRPTLRIMRDP